MFKVILVAGAMAAFPVVAYADDAAPVAGAAGGAVAGAIVGGPIGAVIGGVGGAIVGGLASNREPGFRRYVVEQRRPSYRWDGTVAVGAELPGDVTYWDVPPEYGVRDYRYTVVDDTPVLVDPRTRRIVQIVGGGDNRDMRAAAPVERNGTVEGMSDDQQTRFDRYVDQEHLPSYHWNDRVAVGAELPPDVTFWDVPHEYGVRNYRYTIVNGSKVLVDPHTRRIVRILGEGERNVHGEIRNGRPVTGERDTNGKMQQDRTVTGDRDTNGEMRKDRTVTGDRDMRSPDARGAPVEGRAASETRRRDEQPKDNVQPQQ